MATKTARKPKMIQRESTIEGLVSDSFSEFQNLRDEITEWADNLEGANMEHLPKYEEVSECRDALENFCDNDPQVPAKVPTGLDVNLKWEEPKPKKKRTGRAWRCGEAASDVNHLVEYLQDFLDKHEDAHDEVWGDTSRQEWEQFVTELEEAKDEAEAVSFPGMY